MDRQPHPPAALTLAPRRALGRGVVLVDPDPGMRRVVGALLEGHQVPVVAEAAEVGQAVAVAGARNPAVVVVAMPLGDRRVLRVAHEIAAMGPRVVLLTSTDPAVIDRQVAEAAVGQAAALEPGR